MRGFILTIILGTFSLLGVAQDHIEAINEIKLSGKYFTAEATASNVEDANKLALMSLIENISGYCEEMELPEIPEDKVKAALLSKTVKRGDAVMVLVYVPRDIVKATGTITFTPYNHASEANNTETIKDATEKLTTVFYQISEQLYKQNAAAGTEGQNAGAEGATNDGNVYDADYKVEDDGNNNQ